MKFLAELRDRRLFQITATYAATGWVALEVINQMIERGLFPELAFRVGLVWYLGGLVAALVLGWYHGEKGHQVASGTEVAFLSVVGVVVLAGTGLTVSSYGASARAALLPASGGSLDHRRVAVLYFQDGSADGSLGYLADGLTEALIGELAGVSSLDVLSENGALAYKGSDLPTERIARDVGAGTVVTGTVAPVGNAIRLSVALADGESGAEFRREVLERPADAPLDLIHGLGEEVALLLRAWLGEEVAVRGGRDGATSVAGWTLFQRAERSRKDAEDRLHDDDLAGAAAALAAADSLAGAAEAADPAWTKPIVLRARVARRLTQLSASDPLEAGSFIERGIAHADRALGIDRRDAAALENRGILRYFRWALNLEHDPGRARALLRDAESDLAAATASDPTRAEAWNALSILHSQKPDLVESKIAARRAYEADAYLRAADAVLWTLYSTSYDLEQFSDAVQYCAEGRRRFPDDARFLECEMWLLSSPGVQPDPERAWRLYGEYEAMAPPHLREYMRARGGTLTAGALARASLPDSAARVFERYRAAPSVDPERELLSVEAVFRLQMGQEAEALRLIKTYLTASPEHREGWRWTSHWWWRPLRDNPEFRALVGGLATSS